MSTCADNEDIDVQLEVLEPLSEYELEERHGCMNAWWALISAHFGYELTLWMRKHSSQLKTLALLSWHLKWWSQIQFANMYSSSVLHKAYFLYKLPLGCRERLFLTTQRNITPQTNTS